METNPNLPAVSEDDKRCNFVYEESSERCKAFHTHESPFCNIHAGNLAAMNEKRRLMLRRRKEAVEDLEYSFHDLQTLDGIAVFLEKLVNGVMSGHIKRDRAGMISMFLPTLTRLAMMRRPTPGSGLTIDIKETKRMQLTFESPQEMDAFLQASDQYAYEILDHANQHGRLKLEKKKDKGNVIDIQAKEVATPEELKIPARELSKMSEATQIPLTKDQVVDLFGEFLGDTKPGSGPGAGVYVDLTGFDDLFQPYGKGCPPGFLHDWKKHLDEFKQGIAYLKYKCSQCGVIVDRMNEEECKP